MRQSGQTAAKGRGIKKLLSLVLVTAMVFSCGISSAFAAGTEGFTDSGIELRFRSSPANDENNPGYYDGDSVAKKVQEISFNTKYDSVGFTMFISSIGKVKAVTVSNQKDFYPEVYSSTKDGSSYESRISVGLWQPGSKKIGDEFTTDFTVTLENGGTATFKNFTAVVTDTPCIDAILVDGKTDIWNYDSLGVGKTYNLTADILDKAGILKGKDFALEWGFLDVDDGISSVAKVESTGLLTAKLAILSEGEVTLFVGPSQTDDDDTFFEGSSYDIKAVNGGGSNVNPPSNNKPSSGGGSSSAKTGVTMTDKIASAQNAAAGDTVSLSVSKGDIIPATLLDAITGKDVNLTISYDGKTYTVNGKALKPAAGIVIYYTPEELIAALGASATTTATAATGKGYAVKANDSLWDIAQRELGNGARFPEIIAANKLKTNFLKVGQTLIMPAK